MKIYGYQIPYTAKLTEQTTQTSNVVASNETIKPTPLVDYSKSTISPAETNILLERNLDIPLMMKKFKSKVYLFIKIYKNALKFTILEPFRAFFRGLKFLILEPIRFIKSIFFYINPKIEMQKDLRKMQKGTFTIKNLKSRLDENARIKTINNLNFYSSLGKTIYSKSSYLKTALAYLRYRTDDHSWNVYFKNLGQKAIENDDIEIALPIYIRLLKNELSYIIEKEKRTGQEFYPTYPQR